MKYKIGNSAVEVRSGDICDSCCEVVVSSDDSHLSQGGGVSLAIARAGGDSIADQARRLVPVELGDVAMTTAGDLRQKYIFHAVTIDFENYRQADDDVQEYIVCNSVRRCFRLMAELDLTSIAFPLIGTGVAGIPAERACDLMAKTFAEELRKTNRGLEIQLWLHGVEESVADSSLAGICDSDGANGGLLSTEYVTAATAIGTGAAASLSVGAVASSFALGPIATIAAGGMFLAKRMMGKKMAGAIPGRGESHADGVHPGGASLPSDGQCGEVFISYSRMDSDMADWVCSVLRDAGISYWRDVDGTYSGQNFKGVIVRAIRASHTVFFLSSDNSNSSRNVVSEIGAALYFQKHVIPIRLDDAEYHDDLLLDLLNLDNIDIANLGRNGAAAKMKNIVLLNRRRAEIRG